MKQTMHGDHARDGAPYARLAGMVVLSFLSMYVLMYAMVNEVGNAVPNLNQLYMAGLMVAPMVLIELALMGRMYPSKMIKGVLVVVSVAAMLLFWMLIRQQVGISDRQFVKSMIPHHAGAILMCQKNRLRDPELQNLCKAIVSSQQSEIDLMKTKLN